LLFFDAGRIKKLMSIRLTVAICAYNAEKRLGAALEALASQKSNASWDLLIIDNRSEDGTVRIASQFLQSVRWPSHVSFRIICEEKLGLSYARARAVAEATGEIISFVDDDNIVEPDWVEECVSFFDRYHSAGLAGGIVYPIFEQPESKPVDFEMKFATALACRDLGPIVRELSGDEDPPCGAGMTCRTAAMKELLSKYGLLLSDRKGMSLSAGGDTEIGLRFRHLGWQTWYVPKMRMGHVLPPHRLTDQYLARVRVGFAASSIWLDVLKGRREMYSQDELKILARSEWLKIQKMRLICSVGVWRHSRKLTDRLALDTALNNYAIFRAMLDCYDTAELIV